MKEKPFSRPRRIRAIPVKLLYRQEERERWNEWSRLAEAVQAIANDCYALWQAWHVQRGSDLQIRKWMAAYFAAKNAKKKTTKCPVHCWPAEFGKQLWRDIDARHGTTHSRVRTLVINKLQKTLTKTGGTNSAWKRWILILSGRGQYPSSSRPLPIPFDCGNGRLQKNGEAGNPWRFELRLDRNPEDGKSELQTLRLSTGGYKNHGLRTILERIESGDYEFKGSNLLQRDGTWWIELCYTMPPAELADVDSEKTAFVTPAVRRPLDLWLGGRPEGLRRSGRDIGQILRGLSSQFRSRQEHYKRQSSAGKGKGRKRATSAWRDKLGARRKDAKKTYNEQLAAAVIGRCIQERCGRVVFFQPTDKRKASRFLERCDDWIGWDWHQLKTLLSRRCEELGIEFENRQLDGSGASWRAGFLKLAEPQPVKGKRVRKDQVKKGAK